MTNDQLKARIHELGELISQLKLPNPMEETYAEESDKCWLELISRMGLEDSIKFVND